MEETWKDIDGFEGYYQVSNQGRVRSFAKSWYTEPLILKQHINADGYANVYLSWAGKGKKVTTYKVHRLVAQAFIPNPLNKREVNHIDGDKKNNAVWNLEWVTSSENSRHATITGLTPNCKAVRIVETGEVFPSLGECARTIGGNAGNISRCLHTDKSDTHKGFHFERVVQYE